MLWRPAKQINKARAKRNLARRSRSVPPIDQQVAHMVASWLLSGLNFKQNASAKDFK